MNKSFYSETIGAVNPAPVHYSTTDAATAAQKFTVAPHVRLDNAFIDLWAPACGAQAWIVLTMLLRWKGNADEAHPRKATLAAACGMSEHLVSKALAKLAQLGLIESRARFAADGAQTANGYYFLVPAYSDTPAPVSKNNPGPYPKFKGPKQKKQIKKKTETTNSANTELIVDFDKSSFVETTGDRIAHTTEELSAIEPNATIELLLVELERLSASNTTTRRLVESDPNNAATQLQNLAAAKNVQKPGAWFNAAMKARRPVATPKAPDVAAAEADCANSDARQLWRRDTAPAAATAPDTTPAEVVARRMALIAATLAMLTPADRLISERCIADLDLRAQCEYLDRTTIEFAVVRKSLAKPQ